MYTLHVFTQSFVDVCRLFVRQTTHSWRLFKEVLPRDRRQGIQHGRHGTTSGRTDYFWRKPYL